MSRVLIFLDVDGVLNSLRSCVAYGGFKPEGLDPVAIKLLDRLAQELVKAGKDPDVVISSTWRMMFPSPDWWNRLWLSHGCQALFTVGMTDTGAGIRGEQVNRWRAKHAPDAPFVCIDDDSDFLPDQPHVKTDFEGGLQVEQIARAFEVLTGEPATWPPRRRHDHHPNRHGPRSL